MTAEDCLARVRSARERIRNVERELIRPRADTWERCSPHVDAAAALIGEAEFEIGAAGDLSLGLRAEMRDELLGLKRDLRRINVLAAAAIEHYQVWSQLLGLALTGYSAEGRVIPFSAPAQLSVEG